VSPAPEVIAPLDEYLAILFPNDGIEIWPVGEIEHGDYAPDVRSVTVVRATGEDEATVIARELFEAIGVLRGKRVRGPRA